MYKTFARPILFRFDPEKVHEKTIRLGRFCGNNTATRFLLGKLYHFSNPMLEQEVLGVRFANPVGLAAGFDKNGYLTQILPEIGFGFMEVGSVTARPCEGNPKPRLWRLPEDKAIVVYYGLCNEGCDSIYNRLSRLRFKIPLFISIAKTNDPSIKGEKSVKDYLYSFKRFENLTDFITINVSCPNTGDGRSFEDPLLLEGLLNGVRETSRRVFLKVSPDLTHEEVDALIKVCGRYKVDGLIISNLTKKNKVFEEKLRQINAKGGVSGKAVSELSLGLLRYVYEKTKGRFVLVGCGVISSAKEAYTRIKSGASLVQLITGMIYEGPAVVKKINKGMVRLLKKDGCKNIAEAVGTIN